NPAACAGGGVHALSGDAGLDDPAAPHCHDSALRLHPRAWTGRGPCQRRHARYGAVHNVLAHILDVPDPGGLPGADEGRERSAERIESGKPVRDRRTGPDHEGTSHAAGELRYRMRGELPRLPDWLADLPSDRDPYRGAPVA